MTAQKPSDTEIIRYLECLGQSDVVSWINLDEHHRNGELARKGLQLVDPYNTNIYHWIAAKIVEIPFVLNTTKDAIKVGIMVGNPSDWSILSVGLDERICIILRVV